MEPESTSSFAEEPVVVAAAMVEPQEPRLGIMHLIVWTACVAVYFSFMRTMSESGQAGYTGVLSVSNGLGMGTALAGLVLLVSRRWRGFPLAKYPGEYLLLASGVNLVFSVVMPVMSVLFMPIVTQGSRAQYLLVAVYLASLLANALILLLAAILVRARRWRVFFVIAFITSAMYVLAYLVPFLGLFRIAFFARFMGVTFQFTPQIASAALVVIALMDLFRRKRYPWQHWLGVGLRLWFSAMSLVGFVYSFIFSGSAF